MLIRTARTPRTPDQTRRLWRTRFGVICALWLVLTGASALVYHATWAAEGAGAVAAASGGGVGGGGAGGRAEDSGGALKLACNALQLVGAPVWYSLWVFTGDTSSWRTSIVGSAGTWGAWGAALLVLLAVRDWWLARTPRRSVAPPRPTHAFLADDQPREEFEPPPNPMRRRLLFDVPVAGLILAGAGAGGAATLVKPWQVEVRRYRVRIANLPKEFDGFRIIQISDTHMGPRVPAEFLDDVVAQALAMQGDLIVLTGDYVHMGAAYSASGARVFAPIVAAVDKRRLIGVAGVLGNHDHYAGATRVSGDMRSVGVPMIDNDRVFVDFANRRLVGDEPAGPCIALCGFGDFSHSSADPAKAFRGVKPGTPRIVLAHNPDSAEDPHLLRANGTAAERVDLMLSGHTHGGQVALPVLGPLVTFSRHWKKYAHGLNHGPLGPVITSAGIGMSVFPVRWGVPPEIVEVTLTPMD